MNKTGKERRQRRSAMAPSRKLFMLQIIYLLHSDGRPDEPIKPVCYLSSLVPESTDINHRKTS